MFPFKFSGNINYGYSRVPDHPEFPYPAAQDTTTTQAPTTTTRQTTAVTSTPAQSTCISGVDPSVHSSCKSPSADMIQLDTVNVAAALAAHNDKRASPSLEPQPNPPLVQLQWDNELAQTASAYASTCPSGHDSSSARTVPSKGWNWVGQNIYWYWSSGWPSANVSNGVESWFDEINDFEYGTGALGGKVIGHYTQLVWSETTHVGCGQAVCNSDTWKMVVIICNYGPG